MDRLARCPECGGVTHPLAQHLPRSAPESVDASHQKKEADPVEEEAERCDNCGRPLGKLQTPLEWDGHHVCGPCHRMLSLEKSPPKAAVERVVAMEVTDAEEAAPSVLPSLILPSPKRKNHPSDFMIMARAICIGLVIVAVALWAIVSILQSVGYLVMWGAIAIVILAAIYWIRKAILSLRRRAMMLRATSER